jgi:hypothetical protein
MPKKKTILVWMIQMWVGLVPINELNERTLQINGKNKDRAPGWIQGGRPTVFKFLFQIPFSSTSKLLVALDSCMN